MSDEAMEPREMIVPLGAKQRRVFERVIDIIERNRLHMTRGEFLSLQRAKIILAGGELPEPEQASPDLPSPVGEPQETPATPREDQVGIAAQTGYSSSSVDEGVAVGDSLPADFPHREILVDNGYSSLTVVAEASDAELIAVKGVVEARLREIRDALRELGY
jgi:hypothetical protein